MKKIKEWSELLVEYCLSNVVKLPEHYTGIDDLPILKYDNIKKGEGIENLLVKKQKLSGLQKKQLKKVFRAIENEFLKVFGFPRRFALIMEKKKRIADLKLKKIIKKDKSIQNYINRHERELRAMLGNSQEGTSMDIYQGKIIIERSNPGLHLPLNVVSVREFYSYLKDIENKAKHKIK